MKLQSPFLREIQLKKEPEDWNVYPFSIPYLQRKKLHLSFDNPVTFFVGENGSGKSTLLEAIAVACGFHPAGGNRNTMFSYHATESPLADFLQLVWNFKMTKGFFLRAESFFNFASYLEQSQEELPQANFYMPYGNKSLHQQSHGESFLALFHNQFRRGIYVLDEPEAALSPQKQIAFLAKMHALAQSGDAQFIIASHSPILLSYPKATIYSFDGESISTISFEETEHFKVTKDFLASYPTFYKHFMRENSEDEYES